MLWRVAVRGWVIVTPEKLVSAPNPPYLTGQAVARFVYATYANVPDYMVKGGTAYRLVTDHLGSPRLVVNAADGTVMQRLDYDEWSRVVLDTNLGFQPGRSDNVFLLPDISTPNPYRLLKCRAR